MADALGLLATVMGQNDDTDDDGQSVLGPPEKTSIDVIAGKASPETSVVTPPEERPRLRPPECAVEPLIPSPAARRRNALQERLEWAAARPMSPRAAACDLLEPLAWVFDLVAATTPDPWGPAGGRVAWRILRLLETVAEPSNRPTAAILVSALHLFGESVKGDDETARGASALDVVEMVEAALGLDRPPPPHAAPLRGLLPPPPESGSPLFYESFLARVRAQANVDGAFAFTRWTGIYEHRRRSDLCRRRSPPWARRTLAVAGPSPWVSTGACCGSR